MHHRAERLSLRPGRGVGHMALARCFAPVMRSVKPFGRCCRCIKTALGVFCVVLIVAACGSASRPIRPTIPAVRVPLGFERSACRGFDEDTTCFARRQSIVLGARVVEHLIWELGLQPLSKSIACVPRAQPIRPSLRAEHCSGTATQGVREFTIAAASAVIVSGRSIRSARGGLAAERGAGTRLEVVDTSWR
jgi:hypothetical protein